MTPNLSFAGSRIDDGPNLQHSIRRKSTLARMFANHLRIRCNIDAGNLIVHWICGPSSRRTLHDFCEIPCSCSGLSCPAPGIFRSIKNFGITPASNHPFNFEHRRTRIMPDDPDTCAAICRSELLHALERNQITVAIGKGHLQCLQRPHTVFVSAPTARRHPSPGQRPGSQSAIKMEG